MEQHEIKFEEWIEIRNKARTLYEYVFGVDGSPGLETRMCRYADDRDAHKENNVKQIVSNFQALFDRYDSKQDRLQRLVYVGFGIVVTLNSVAIIAVALVRK